MMYIGDGYASVVLVQCINTYSRLMIKIQCIPKLKIKSEAQLPNRLWVDVPFYGSSSITLKISDHDLLTMVREHLFLLINNLIDLILIS